MEKEIPIKRQKRDRDKEVQRKSHKRKSDVWAVKKKEKDFLEILQKGTTDFSEKNP